jgi:glutamine---fructose-6-phosphate transaminase (isomerizing)
MMQSDVLEVLAAKLTDLRLNLSEFDGLVSGKYRRVVFTGMGSSFHACYPTYRRIMAAGFESHWIETAELLTGFDFLFHCETLVVAVSQSGESAEIVGLMKRASELGYIIGVTNNANSCLGKSAGTVLELHAGVESTVSCKTYVATLAVLRWLERQWLGHTRIGMESKEFVSDLQATQTLVREYLKRWQQHVADLAPILKSVSSIFVTGRGDSIATAGTGGLILKESTRQHAEGMSGAAFRHGPLEMAGERTLVLILEGSPSVVSLQRRLAADVARGGGRSFLVGPDAEGLDVFRLPRATALMSPILEILPVQMVSLALAARDGFEAGRFERASKITNVE